MYEFTYTLIGWSLALILLVILGTKNGNKFRKKEKDMHDKFNMDMNNYIKEKEETREIHITQIRNNRTEYEKVLKENKEERDILIKERNDYEDINIKLRDTMGDNTRGHITQVNEMRRNADNQAKTLADEIETLEGTIGNYKIKLQSEQVDSNNKQYARDKWKAKFEALTNIVTNQNNGDFILKKYKHNWKVIVTAYENARK